MKVIVLLSSYNGEKYISSQIDSLLSQTQSGVEILVRDDGSTDSTRQILASYAGEEKLRWFAGENLGYARSFWTLINQSGGGDFYAFCDQDDVWDEDKLETAVNALAAIPEGTPGLYFSDVRVADSELNTISEHMVRPMPNDYPHSLVRNVSPGCTYVFNAAAAELLRKYDPDVVGIDYHDWTVYRIVACMGQVIIDPRSHMSYRQHGGNQIGANEGMVRYVKKIRSFFNGKMTNSRRTGARRLLSVYGEMMSDGDRELTKLLAEYSESLGGRLRLLGRRDFGSVGADRVFMTVLILMGKY